MSMATYPAAKPTGVCAATGRRFAPGEAYVATFIERPGAAAIDRQDFSVESWDQGARPAPPAIMLGYWRASYSASAAPRQPLLGDAELLDLFESLTESPEPKARAFRYFVTLLLVRRRQLRLMGTKGKAMLVLPKGATGEPIAVEDPGLDDAVVADAIDQLGRVLAIDAGSAAEGA